MLHALLRRLIRVGDLTIRYDSGREETYGDGTGAPVTVRMSGRGARRIAANPQLGLGEAFMEGDMEIERGDIWDLFDVVGRNQAQGSDARLPGALGLALKRARGRLQQMNDRRAAKRNVAHHYDLSYDLYRRFLDQDMQYSCAYWSRPGMTLDEAQAAKKAHLASKMRLEPGMRVLDIGCGWGGLGLELGKSYGCEVVGITLSREQLAIAQKRAEAAGLADRVRFELTDFRDVQGRFDRIVSVGMFEHVGVPNYRAYFHSVGQLLTDEGVAVIHSIGRRSPPAGTNPWILKYIFPGGYIPALSETLAAVEDVGLWVTDLEILRVHYGETLKAWRERFNAVRPEIASLYDERFCRMWEFYLACSELAFRYGSHMNFQLQLTKRVGALPMTRDYMVDAERAGPRGMAQAAE
jgi:cyclopropane-fatty-acyl-phospholipid synthase